MEKLIGKVKDFRKLKLNSAHQDDQTKFEDIGSILIISWINFVLKQKIKLFR